MSRRNTNKRWTSEEDRIVAHQINRYPNNLQFAFSKASEELTGRSPGAISGRYYQNLSKRDTPLLAMASASGVRVVNRKNSPIPRKAKTAEMRLEIVLSAIDKMSSQDRKEIVKYILDI